MLRWGAEIDSRDLSGNTALRLAIRGGYVETVKALLARGAGVEAGALAGTPAGLTELLRGKMEPGAPFRPSSVATALQAIGEAISLYSQMPGVDQDLRRRASGAHADLEARAARWRQTSTTPVEYGQSLTRDAMILKSGLKARDPAVVKRILQTVADDLEAKIEDCERKGAALSTIIKLRVRTIRSGREVNNFQVLYLPKIMEVALDAQPDIFPGFSSPTADNLAPGRYLFWARDPQTGKTSERMPVRVGGGMSEIVLDLPVR